MSYFKTINLSKLPFNVQVRKKSLRGTFIDSVVKNYGEYFEYMS